MAWFCAVDGPERTTEQEAAFPDSPFEIHHRKHAEASPSLETSSTAFRFLDLPPEIRSVIYDHVGLRDDKKRYITFVSHPPTLEPLPALLRVNKQVRSEAADCYFGDSKFDLRLPPHNDLSDLFDSSHLSSNDSNFFEFRAGLLRMSIASRVCFAANKNVTIRLVHNLLFCGRTGHRQDPTIGLQRKSAESLAAALWEGADDALRGAMARFTGGLAWTFTSECAPTMWLLEHPSDSDFDHVFLRHLPPRSVVAQAEIDSMRKFVREVYVVLGA